MFGIRSLLVVVTWLAILSAAFVTARALPERLAHLPATLAWDVFALSCMYAALSAILSTRNRGFWIGFAIFGFVPMFFNSLHSFSMIQHPSAGQAIIELSGFGVNPDTAGDDAYFNYIRALVPIAELVIASLSSVFGGLLGIRIAQPGIAGTT